MNTFQCAECEQIRYLSSTSFEGSRYRWFCRDCRAMRRARDAGVANEDIPNLVFAFVPSFGPAMGRDVLNEMRGVREPTEGFM